MFSSRTLASSLIKQIVFFLCLIPAGVAASNGIETVTLQLKWQHQFQFAGYYAALDKGFYREAGLDVKIQSHGPGLKSPVEQVLSGSAQYGVLDSSLVKHRLDGEPVVALAVIFQKSPLIWLVHQDSGIHSPHDLVDKQVMYLPGLQSGDLLAMLQVEGIPISKINLISSSFDVQDLIDGKTDAFNAYSTNEPYILREQGIPYRLISPRNYGIDFYGDLLFTSESEIDEHPERVKAFRLASLKGWQYAMDHPDEIIDLIVKKYAPDKSRPNLEFEAEEMRDLIMPDLITIGHMNPGRWRVIAERFVTLGFTEANYNQLERFAYDPSPKPQDLKQFYVVIALTTLLALLFMGLAIWIWQLNIRFKKNEHEIRVQRDFVSTVLDVASNIIVALDLKGNFVRFNHAAELLTGYKSEEVIGKPFWQLVIPDEQMDGVRAVFDNLAKGNTEIAGQYENEWVSRYGERKLLHWHNTVLRDDEGVVSHIVALGYDITMQKENEAEQVRLQNELQQAQKMESLGQLTGGIAHDFNNLLGIINGYAGLSLNKYSDKIDEKLLEYIQNINEAGKRATDLVTQMLAFSRGDECNDMPLKLSLLIKEDIKLLRSTLPTSIEIETEIDPELPGVLMNPTQLHQILMNLSINARDAMDGVGKLRIQLRWARGLNTVSDISHKPIQGDWIELSISDTGSGIAPEIVQNIFNPFFTTKEVGKGTGMGLSVIYRIMENHGGHIMLKSELGKGSTFRMLFPPILEDTDNFKDMALEPVSIPKGDGSEILVVDDEPMLAAHMSELVKGQGYKATYVTDSNEALVIFKQEPERFSMLITDQTMPKMSGTELISSLRDIRPNLPAIICSGYSDKVDINSAAALNIFYISKPADVDKLLLKVAELLSKDG